jgi:hypothetical protein
MRIAVAVALLSSGCVSYLYTRKDNDCAKGDEVCKNVVANLENQRPRHSRGCVRFCFTGPSIASECPAALPYLANAFDDRDPEVAEFAMEQALELGGEELVVEWCGEARDRLRIMMCRKALGAD